MKTRLYDKNRTKILLSFFIIILLTGCIIACAQETRIPVSPVSKTGFHFDTVITISLYSTSDEKLLDSSFELAAYYENLFSKTKEGSDIYRINHADGAPTKVSPETAELLEIALDYAILTDGAVDPTIGAVSTLWNFHKDTTDSENKKLSPPSDNDIKLALSHVNYKNVQISGNIITLSDPDACLDLGFIAKGYIADKIKEYLLSQGVTSALINLGGNVLAVGSKPDNSPFIIGIQKPFANTGTPVTTVSANDISVVSSGVYERYFEYDDQFYHHILDSKTGYPVENDLLAVSILSESSTDGDALSTTCLALGFKDAYELMERLENIDAIFITSDGEIHTTY